MLPPESRQEENAIIIYARLYIRVCAYCWWCTYIYTYVRTYVRSSQNEDSWKLRSLRSLGFKIPQYYEPGLFVSHDVMTRPASRVWQCSESHGWVRSGRVKSFSNLAGRSWLLRILGFCHPTECSMMSLFTALITHHHHTRSFSPEKRKKTKEKQRNKKKKKKRRKIVTKVAINCWWRIAVVIVFFFISYQQKITTDGIHILRTKLHWNSPSLLAHTEDPALSLHSPLCYSCSTCSDRTAIEFLMAGVFVDSRRPRIQYTTSTLTRIVVSLRMIRNSDANNATNSAAATNKK